MKKILSRVFLMLICLVSAVTFAACDKKGGSGGGGNGGGDGAPGYIIDNSEMIKLSEKSAGVISSFVEESNDTGAYDDEDVKRLNLGMFYNYSYVIHDLATVFDSEEIKMGKLYNKLGSEKFISVSSNGFNTKVFVNVVTYSPTDGFLSLDYKIVVDEGEISSISFRYLQYTESPIVRVVFAGVEFDNVNKKMSVYSGVPMVSSDPLEFLVSEAFLTENNLYKVKWGSNFVLNLDLAENAQTPYSFSKNTGMNMSDLAEGFKDKILEFNFVELCTNLSTYKTASEKIGNDVLFEYLNGTHIRFNSTTSKFENDAQEESNV